MPDAPITAPLVDTPAIPPVVAPVVAPVVVVDPAAQSWFNGADAETIGHLQNRGWDKKPANEVALEAVKAHREAEKFIGAPPAQLARIPTDVADEKGWADFWAKLGAPTDATKYDFSAIKLADGSDVGDDFRDFLRTQVAGPNHMPPAMAASVAAAMTKYIEGKVTTSTAERTASVEQSKAELAKNWGANTAANEFVAGQAMAKLGVSPALIEAMKASDYAGTYELFRKIGAQIGEDKFVTNSNPAIPGIMTRDQAIARKAELMKDTAWAERYMAGGSAENRELQALLTIITAAA